MVTNNKPKATKPIECQACHKTIEIGQIVVNHHVTYFPEKVIPVHTSCHTCIHVGHTLYQELRPDPRQVTRWYKKRNKNMHIQVDAWSGQFETFMHHIEHGFLIPEPIEQVNLRVVKEYWDSVQKYHCNKLS